MIKVALLTIVSLTLGALCPAWSAEQDEAALIKGGESRESHLAAGLDREPTRRPADFGKI